MKSTWYVAYTNVQAEQRAADRLARGGFETFLPMHLRVARRHHGRIFIERPLFPRYLFVGSGPECSWGYLHGVEHIQGMIAHDGVPIKVSAGTMDQLRAAVATGEFDERPPAGIKAGAHVRFSRGPFEGLIGVCGLVASETRVDVLVDILKREVSVNVPFEHLSVVRATNRMLAVS